jgi:prephenate dehydratase
MTSLKSKQTVAITEPVSGGVAIQGFEGSFHQIAAESFFGKGVPVVCCATFRELVKKAARANTCFAGLMAIENSIAGSLLPNYNLLQNADLEVVGEVYLQIRHHLLVNPGVALEDIREVHSHPMAILQCIDFLDKHSWKLVETEDTALSAKHIHQHKSIHIASIASNLAADLYSLEKAATDIQSQKNNYTRFLVLKRKEDAIAIDGANKASVNFTTDNSRGSLAKVLVKIARQGINLTKLQSFPVPGSDWLYSFHADMEFDSVEHFNTLIKKILPLTTQLKVYGVYKSGKLK